MSKDKSRSISELWWEDNDLHIIYADNGDHVKFVNVTEINRSEESNESYKSQDNKDRTLDMPQVMKVKFDEQQIELTKEFEDALIKVMQEECKMMSRISEPENWYWGRCEIKNLASCKGMIFFFGSKVDLPDDGLGQFAVVVNEC